MEGGDVLYIIIMIVVFLGSFLRKMKKATQKEQAQPMPTFSGKEADDFEDWFSNKNEIEEIEVPQKPLKEEIIVKTYENTEDVSTLRIQKNINAQIKNKKRNDSAIPDNSNINTDLNIKLSTAEDARRAFIYSEIFQRKY